mgnify:CR=1 FL=1
MSNEAYNTLVKKPMAELRHNQEFWCEFWARTGWKPARVKGLN